MKKRPPAILLIALAAAAPLYAQERPPTLLIQGTGTVANAESLPIAELAVQARIVGPVAETRMTMVFANPNERELAGDLYFPLPEGATVSGYALDIEGVMVDGVVVEKAKGRQVFEKIVRQGVDPGLVELTKGNNFKTRVFPIPAKGTRTVMVRYVTEVSETAGGATYRLPLRFSEAVGKLSIRVEVVKTKEAPKVKTSGVQGLVFKPWRDSFVAESSAESVKLEEDVVIVLPPIESQPVLVEQAPDGEHYFCIAHTPPRPEIQSAVLLKSIGILWDASGSRGSADHTRELEILEQFLKARGDIDVALRLFRNTLGEPRSFRIKGGDSRELLAALRDVDYDGGTQMGAISMTKSAILPDAFLVFTDGLSTFGQEMPTGLPQPLYIVSADPTANHSFLRHLATAAGGEYFNLARVTNTQVVQGIGRPSFRFMSATVDSESVAELTPDAGRTVHGRFLLAGRLTSKRRQSR